MSKLLRLNDLYWQARNYAYYLCRFSGVDGYVDIVHDAYVSYHKYNDGNLFEQDKKIVLSTIRSVWKNKIRSKQYVSNGILQTRIFHPVAEEFEEDERGYVTLTSVAPSIEEQVDYVLLKDRVKSKLTTEENEIVDNLICGYGKYEIIQDKAWHSVKFYNKLKKIRTKVQQVL